MQGAASALMQAFKAAFPGTDWDKIAYKTMVYGGAGVSGWGSLCGVPNACVAVLNLIGLHGALGSSVMGYVSETPIPTTAVSDLYYADAGYGPSNYTYPKQPIHNDDVLARTVSHSPLCHVAVSKFLYAAGIHQGTVGPTGYGIRPDRCAKLVGDAAAYTAELINQYALDNGNVDPYSVSEATASCQTCHVSKSLEHGPAINGIMDCSQCHADGTFHRFPSMILNDIWMTDQGSTVAKTSFTHGQMVTYHARFFIQGPAAGFVRLKPYTSGAKGYKTPSGTWAYYLDDKSGTYISGAQDWTWDKQIPADASGAAMYRVTLEMADEPAPPVLGEATKTMYFNVS